jgi:hypothetical protein
VVSAGAVAHIDMLQALVAASRCLWLMQTPLGAFIRLCAAAVQELTAALQLNTGISLQSKSGKSGQPKAVSH